MERKCDSCRYCDLFKEPNKETIGACHGAPPSKVVYSDAVRIEFAFVTAGFYCRLHKFRRWSRRWFTSFDFIKVWK